MNTDAGEQLEKIETLDGQLSGKAGRFEQLVERLAAVIHDGSDAAAERHARAVLADLARIGVDDALPSADDLGDITDDHADVSARETLELYADHVRLTITPILAAKDAELDRAWMLARKMTEARDERDAALVKLAQQAEELERLRKREARLNEASMPTDAPSMNIMSADD